MKKLLFIFVATIALATGTAATADQASIEQFNMAFSEANELRKAAGQAAHEWRDTAKLLRSAQAAAEQGDLEKAMMLVAEARFQSVAAVAQAEREQRLWEGRVVR
ncbi:MAG: hypothetical protein OXI60_05975 [Acidiferrobacterales bacterium]|nr:hypothetical protein [Acidiferrobacterales bacterium]